MEIANPLGTQFRHTGSKGTFLTSSRVLECQQFDHQFFFDFFSIPQRMSDWR
jgi:hypothetical protein